MSNAEDLVKAANDTAQAARDGLEWIASPQNAELLGNRMDVTRRVLQQGVTAARRLAGAASRPMAVAVFGASQAGKSHVIATLSRRGKELMVLFDGVAEPVSYLRRLNPDKEKEATGLVTRFSLRLSRTPPGFPVQLALLNHADVIKIIANAYIFDGRPRVWAGVEQIVTHLSAFRGSQDGPVVRNGLSEEDIWDLEEYFSGPLGEAQLSKNLGSSDFWRVVARVAPRLPLDRLAALFSILWGSYPQLSELYQQIVRGLQQLDFAATAFVPLAAIDVGQTGLDSILDVTALESINDPAADAIEIRSAAGASARLTRPVVAALAAEVNICASEAAWPFLQHTDLLDFPGYRSRGLKDNDTQSANSPRELLDRQLEKSPKTTIKELILRGKVEYLFQRYQADQDVTAMLLCVKDSNQEVPDLAAVVSRWISQTHGETSAERSGKPTLLYFVLTMFDRAFTQKSSDEDIGFSARFEGRMKASLLELFSSEGNWVQDWATGRPFNNLFLVRNPEFRLESVYSYEGKLESQFRPDKLDWIGQVKAGFLSVPSVRRHFADPVRAFDEVMRTNDGGASYIAEQLATVCRPEVKPRQVRDAILSERRRLDDALAPYYRNSDVAERLRVRRDVAARVLGDLGESEARGRFGSVVRGFMVDGGMMASHLYQSEVQEPAAGTDASRPAPAIAPANATRPAMPGRPAPQMPGSVSPAPMREMSPSTSPHQRLADLAVNGWVSLAFERANHEHFARDVHVGNDNLREIAAELASGAMRVKLGQRIASEIERHAFADERRERRREKAAIIATRAINRFVASLGMTDLPEGERPRVPLPDGSERVVYAPMPVRYDSAEMPPVAVPYRTMAAEDWWFGFYRMVEDNSTFDGAHGIDLRENARLGEILAVLRGTL